MEANPCPFCGNEKLEVEESPVCFWVTCIDCLAEGPPSEDSARHAFELWNRRVADGKLENLPGR